VKVKVVIFDLDGTLLDTVDLYYKITEEIFKRVGLSSISKDKLLEIMRSGKSPWDQLIPSDYEDKENLIEKMKKIDAELWPRMYKDIDFIPGAIELIRWLHNIRIKIGIVTSSWGNMPFFKDKGIDRFIDVIITRDDTEKLKPSPDPIIECLKRLRANNEDAVYIGDSPVDIRAGKGARVRTIGVLTGISDYKTLSMEGPDMIVDSVKDLKNIINKEIEISGEIYSDLGEAKYFTQIDWVREEFINKLNIDPYPGTLNIRVKNSEDLKKLKYLREKSGIEIPPRAQGFCTAKGFKVIINGRIEGAIILPHVSDYPIEKLEIISPVSIKEALKVKDGDMLSLKIYL
jgi:HAD superfamily hydrolase (TIGR01549 family)